MKPHTLFSLLSLAAIALVLAFCTTPKAPDPPQKKPASTQPALLPQIEFLVPAEGFEVARDYNQRLFIPVQNHGPGPARLRLESSHFPDFPSGFVGRGTPDWEEPGTVLEIPEGEIWEAPLLVHGNGAAQDTYTLTLTAEHEGALAGENELLVRLLQPELKLETQWILPSDPLDLARLERRLRIRNLGANLPDLSLRFEPEGPAAAQALSLDPVLENTTLASGQVTTVSLHPYLYPSFEKLAGTLILSGHNQEHRLSYLAEVPEGKAVFVTLSRSTSRNSNSGTRCTNTPGSRYNLPPTSGTPASTNFGTRSGSLGGGGGGRLGVGASQTAPTPPSSDPDPAEKEEEEDDDPTWTLFGPIESLAGESQEETSEPGEEESPSEEEPSPQGTNPDRGTYDLLDANTEGLVGDFLSPEAFGTSLRKIDAPPTPLLTAEALRPLENAATLAQAENSRDQKESSTYVDQEGKRTHLTRRQRPDGAEFLHFGWGLAGPGRKLNGYFGKAPVASPVLGPNPRPNAPALATYVEASPDDEAKTVVRTLDPETGQTVLLSDPEKSADSPLSLRTKNGVETLFREGGQLKRVSLDETLQATPTDAWPAGLPSGPLLSAETLPSGQLALLTQKNPDTLTLRTENTERDYSATHGSLAALGEDLFLAGREPDGTLFVRQPTEPQASFRTADAGYGAPTLSPTREGGLRLFYHKPLPPEAPSGASGPQLGGNFSVDYQDGQWGPPKRLYLPDAPVQDAAVAVEFSPRFADAHYKEMNTGIRFNGRLLRTLEKQIPLGRYLFQVPTSALHYRANASLQTDHTNQVTIDSEGIGPGNFHLAEKCQVYGLHDWTQGCFVAETNAEADRLAQLSSPQMRHDAHDLLLATNGAQLPRDLQPGQERQITLAAFNAGDLASPASRVTLHYEGVPLGGGDLASLASFRGGPVTVRFRVPRTWQPGTSLRLVASVPSEGDADPSSNSLPLDLLREYQPALAGPTRASAIVPASLPPARVTPVAAATADAPAEYSLNGREWFRSQIPDAGDLQIDVSGPDTSLIDGIDLFDAQGRPLRPASGTWQTQGNELYLRVALPPGQTLSSETKIQIWWD
ncbi:MAG: hypothetical protein AAF555_07205 [Verrucomicrobiota bacterium]